MKLLLFGLPHPEEDVIVKHDSSATAIRVRPLWIAIALFGMAHFDAVAADDKALSAIRSVVDVEYAAPGGHSLKIDFHFPATPANSPLILYIHGGSWRTGDRKGCPVKWLAEHGYAVASIDYRLSQQATFPAQIHDCKGAVRWLRANASNYGFSAEKIAVVGSSAGGHLAVLLGTSAGVAELEGDVGGNAEQSSAVQAVVDYYGPTDFVMRAKTQPENTDAPKGNVYQLLGAAVGKNVELAKLASGVTHVGAGDPPLLIIQGLMDKKVEPSQSVRLFQAYRTSKLPVQIQFVEDGAHGGDIFYTGPCRDRVVHFLAEHFVNPSK